MDRNQQPQKYPQKYTGPNKFNGNYVSQPQIDYSEIDALYSTFSTGEYDDMIKIIQSNKLLNFRNLQGETLIHAILKNGSSSLTETNILEIIQQLIHKNVSINAMNNYNQTALHFAAQKGYYNIITYLLTLNVDLNKIDNYGNAPIHYLIDNFVVDCKQDEYFKETNKKLKKTQQINDYDKITENYMILSLIDKINENPVAKSFIYKMRKIIATYKFYKILDIQKIFDKKKLQIDNIYKTYSSSHNEQIKNITFEMIKELNDNIYKNLLLNNKQNNNEFLNINDAEIKMEQEESNNNKDFNKKIAKIIEISSSLFDSLKGLVILPLFKLSIVTLYFFYFIDRNPRLHVIYNIMPLFHEIFTNVNVNTPIYDYDGIISSAKILNEDSYDEKLKFMMYDYHNLNLDNRVPLTPNNYIEAINLHNVQDNTDRRFILKKINNLEDLQTLRRNHIITPIKINTLIDDAHPTYNKFIQLFNIYEYITKEIHILQEEIKKATILNYNFYYFNFINEKIINIINNLVNFLIYYDTHIDINKIIENLKIFCDSFSDTTPPELYKNFMELLVKQLYLDMPTAKIREQNKVVEIQKTLNNASVAQTLESLSNNLNKSNINDLINEIYKNLILIYNENNSILECVNKYHSLQYLKNYSKYVQSDNNIEIPDIIFNRLYPNLSIFPATISHYRKNYFLQDNTIDLLKIKKELLKKYEDYDYNELYKNDDFEQFVYGKLFYDNIHNGLVVHQVTSTLRTTTTLYNTGFNTYTFNSDNLDAIESNGIFKKKYPIAFNRTVYFVKRNDFNINDNNDNIIPIISLLHVSNLQKFTIYKINLLMKIHMNNIIGKTDEYINNTMIPKKKKDEIKKSLEYLKRDENKELLEKILMEKLILYLDSLITIDSNKEISYIINYFFAQQLQSIISGQNLKNLQTFIKTFYTTELSKYTFNKMVPNILRNNSSIFNELTTLLIDINTTNYTKQQHKLLLNKCISTNKIDILREKILGKINMRILDKNGNTILNRLIDQYNEYAIGKILILDAGLPTYKNNRGQNSIEYLFDIIKTINKSYFWDAIDKRIKTYQDELKIWIQSDKKFGDIQLDNNNNMIYDVILNSLYLFNESLWLILLTAPNGWKFEDKHSLKELIAKYLGYVIEENLLIKTFDDEDVKILNEKTEEYILNIKIIELQQNLEDENEKLKLSNEQLNEEETKSALGINYQGIIKKNEDKIKANDREITKLNAMRKKADTEVSRRYVDAEKYIRNANLIEDVNIDWKDYKKLVVDELWNLYLPIMNICNKKNNTKKYISYYNFSLLNLDYNMLEDAEVLLLVDYYTKFIDNIYADYYDLEKYEDIEFNYINENILNIIYLNVVDVISIEMYSAIVGYVVNKYNNDEIVKKLKNKHNNKIITELYEIINKLLKGVVLDKLNLKNPNYSSNYIDTDILIENMKQTIKIIFSIGETNEDKIFYNNLTDFYKELVEKITHNVHYEILNLLNDMKKNSLLLRIYKIIKSQSSTLLSSSN